jgi:para-nitrobenzyl esterase
MNPFKRSWLLALFVSSGMAGNLTCLEPANRFRTEVFPALKETMDVQFGSNKNPLFNNRVENLLADIFQPSTDNCAKRPLIIFMHGGWFQTGDRHGEDDDCRHFAKRGFVSASIEYRMGVANTFSPANFGTPAFMATQDARAAVRFFRKNAAIYGIDTSLIYVGGCSAGAYAALFTAYLDKTQEIPSFINAGALDGGIEGNSGNPGYDSRFAGTLAISGGVFDTTWINKGDASVVTVQCAADPIVPPGGDSLRNPNTQKPFVQSYGSTAVTARARHMGVPNAILTYNASCHCPHPGGPNGVDSTIDFFGKSVYAMMTAPTQVRKLAVAFSAGDIGGAAADDRVYDLEGKRILPDPKKESPYPASPFQAGLYFLKR